MVSQLRPIRMQSNPDLKKNAITTIFLPEPLDLKFIFKWNINVVISLIKRSIVYTTKNYNASIVTCCIISYKLCKH